MLSVRLAEPDDAMDVARLHVGAWQAAYRGLLPDAELDALRAEDRAARYTFGRSPSHGPVTLVAVQAGSIRGFATVGAARGRDVRGRGELLALYVDPTHWRRGVGALLIESARRRMSGEGFAEAILWVLAGNVPAERFYEHDGWRPDGGRREQAHWGLRASEVRFRRALP